MNAPEKIVSINTKDEPSRAYDRVMRGVNLLADTVKLTLGPYGRNVILEKSGGRISNDGVSVGNEVQATDEVEEKGVQIAREALRKTNDEVGDGTTTATVLSQAILKKCSKYLERDNKLAEKSVMAIKHQIEKEKQIVIEELKKRAIPVKGEEDLIDVAQVSVEDKDLAKLIGSTQWALGKDSMIIVEEHSEVTCEVERIKGVRIDNGLGTSMVINDHERQRLVVDEAPVFLTDYELNDLKPLKRAIDVLLKSGQKEFVVVARAFSSEFIRACMENHKAGILIYPIQAPYINQREIMEDMAAVLGANFIHNEGGDLDDVDAMDFGFAEKVVAQRFSAVFSGSKPVADRLVTLKKQLEGEPSKFNKKQIAQRIAQLETGFALLKVGSISDIDRKYKYDKAEDAVNAVHAAFQEGTVPGAGLVFKDIAESTDLEILKEPLKSVHNQIIDNAGEAFDIPEWVRNAAKVDRCAFENAATVAANLITVGGAIVTKKIDPLKKLLDNKQDHE